jgi:hypothetical protein
VQQVIVRVVVGLCRDTLRLYIMGPGTCSRFENEFIQQDLDGLGLPPGFWWREQMVRFMEYHDMKVMDLLVAMHMPTYAQCLQSGKQAGRCQIVRDNNVQFLVVLSLIACFRGLMGRIIGPAVLVPLFLGLAGKLCCTKTHHAAQHHLRMKNVGRLLAASSPTGKAASISCFIAVMSQAVDDL